MVAGQVTGAIAILHLSKPHLEPIDRELFDLLASQAGAALHFTRLHEAAQGRRGDATAMPVARVTPHPDRTAYARGVNPHDDEE